MTEQMAQKWLEQFEFPTDENSDDALATICEALQEYPKFRAIGTVEEINAKLAELERWHKSEVNTKIKNVFANTSTSICHNCDHKDEYIEELEAEVEELQALKEKSEKGLLLELPCKVGDTVWCIVSAGTKVVECTVLWIEKHQNGVMVFSLDGGLGDVVLAHLGEKWFLTKEEAEKKLNNA